MYKLLNPCHSRGVGRRWVVTAMTRVRDAKVGDFTEFVARAWRYLVEPARTRRVEDEVRFELLKGLVR